MIHVALVLICLTCLAAPLPAATYYLDAAGGNDATGDGSAAAPWATMAKAMATVKPGDTVLLRPGHYGQVEFKEGAGLGSAEGGHVTYAADPATTQPRPEGWYETELPRPDPAKPEGKVIFSGITFALFSRDKDAKTKSGTPAGHYVTLDGLNVVDGNVTLVSYVSHVVIRNCNVFGRWGEFTSEITAQAFNLYRAVYWGSNYRNILIENCYGTRCQGGLMLLGNFHDVTVRGCHFHHFAGSGMSLNGTMEKVLLEGNHVHQQVALPADLKHERKVQDVSQSEPESVFTIDDPADYYDTAVVFSGKTGEKAIREVASFDKATRALKLVEKLPFTPEAGDVVKLYDNAHGSGVAVRAANFTLRGNRVHDCGGTRGIYFYTPGDEGYANVIIENNLFYSTQNQYAIDLNGGMGNGCIIRNNTISGRQHSGYDGNKDATMYYGLALIKATAAKKAAPSTMVVANNIIVGLGSAPAGAVVKNNIVFAGTGFEEDAEGPNCGNLVYCKGGRAGSEPHPFDKSGDFFVGGGRFDELAFKLQHGENFNAAFQLAAKARAIGFADPALAPPTDITGRKRDAAPDAGCYEYEEDGAKE